MASPPGPIPPSPVSNAFEWRDWFSKLSSWVGSSSTTQPWSSSSSSSSTTTVTQALGVTIAVIGDSHSATNQLMPEAWPSILQQELINKGVPSTVYNCACDGMSFYRALNPPNSNFKFGNNNAVQQAISYNPQVVLVMLGGNDTWVDVDSRTVTQAKADALAVFTALRNGLPKAKIVYVSEVWYDTTNYATPGTTLLNQGAIPYFWDLTTTSPTICQGSYCSEAETCTVSAATKGHAGDWVTLDTYIKTLTQIDGWFKEDYWRIARMGGDISDMIHPNAAGRYLQCGYIMQGLKSSFLTSLFGSLNTNNQTDWEDPDALFNNMLVLTGGYATWDPANTGTQITLSNGNLTTLGNNVSQFGTSRATLGKSAGKWYWEVTVTLKVDDPMIGIADSSAALNNHYLGQDTHGWGYDSGTGKIYTNNSGSAYGSSFTTGDIISVALDMDNGKVWFAKNGTWQNSGDPHGGTNAAVTGLSGTIYPAIAVADGDTCVTNFGNTAFSYTVPTGFTAGMSTGTTSYWVETYNLDSEALRYAHNLHLNSSLWYVPYRMRVVITPSAGNTELDMFMWKLEDGPELQAVNISTGDSTAFVLSGTNTDVNGSALAIQSGLTFSQAVGGVGTYKIRYKVTTSYNVSIIAGPYKVTVTNTLKSGTTFASPNIYKNSWVDGGTIGGIAYQPPAFFKDDLGFVHLTGVSKGGTAVAGTVMATLPSGQGLYPVNAIAFPCVSNSLFGFFLVDTSGNITFEVGSNTAFSFEGATWYGNPSS